MTTQSREFFKSLIISSSNKQKNVYRIIHIRNTSIKTIKPLSLEKNLHIISILKKSFKEYNNFKHNKIPRKFYLIHK